MMKLLILLGGRYTWQVSVETQNTFPNFGMTLSSSKNYPKRKYFLSEDFPRNRNPPNWEFSETEVLQHENFSKNEFTY